MRAMFSGSAKPSLMAIEPEKRIKPAKMPAYLSSYNLEATTVTDKATRAAKNG